MKKDNKDILSSKFRQKLTDYELPVREDLWSEIEQNLKPAKTIKRPVWLYVGGVAASLILILSLGWGIYKAQNPSTDGVTAEIPNQELNQIKDQSILHKSNETEGEFTSLVEESEPKPFLLKKKEVKELAGGELDAHNSIEFAENASQQVESKLEQQALVEEQTSSDSKKSNDLLPKQDNYEADFWKDIPKRKKKNDLSFALAYANQGNTSTPTSDVLLRYSKVFASPSFLELDNQEQINNVIISDTRYKTPLTFAFSLRKSLDKRWALESGLTYTYLETNEIKTYVNGADFSDTYELNYIGLPLKMVYSIYKQGNFAAYVSGGGMIEKCIYARQINSETQEKNKLSIPELQWSVGGNIGVSYQILKQLNLFAEPGINYYFDDGGKTPTIRKDKPLNINLQLGLRLDI